MRIEPPTAILQWIHKLINVCKQHLNNTEFFNLCETVYKNQYSKEISITSGYFNPLGHHHINLLNAAKEYGHHICVINNDEQVKIKNKIPFLDEISRFKIISSIRCVDETILSIDNDSSINQTLEFIRDKYPLSVINFCNGGDINANNCLENNICKQLNINIIFGVGGYEKVTSSSQLITKAAQAWNRSNNGG